MEYLIVVEKTETGFSAYSPDVPGCVSTGRTEEETEASMKEAIEFHIDGLKQEGLAVPQASTKSAYCGGHCITRHSSGRRKAAPLDSSVLALIATANTALQPTANSLRGLSDE